MLIIPAIDLKDGRVVRLWQGHFDLETTYSDSPAETMSHWQREGARLVHVVDLDGARDGVPKNIEALERILEVARVPVQFGGGLRDFHTVAAVLRAGVSRVVIGTQASRESLMRRLLENFKERIAVALDVRNDALRIHGWQSEAEETSPKKFCQKLEAMGVHTVILTDTARDGTLDGPNVGLLDRVLEATKMGVIISGGIANFSDLEGLKKIKNEYFIGAIIGRALYEKKFKLSEAIQRFQGGAL